MPGTKVVFCHGLESAPQGSKFRALVDAGYDVVAPDCQGLVLLERVDLVRRVVLGYAEPPLLVGSSYGGLTAVVASAELAGRGVVVPGLILCAPALHLNEPPLDTTPLRVVAPTTIIHGTRDDVVPLSASREFSSRHEVELIEVDDDHRLGASLGVLVAAVARATGAGG
jgi:pimeloyl-ACP methyl ester carboxylesterase